MRASSLESPDQLPENYFKIPAHRFDYLAAKIDKIQAKAAKLGAPVPVFRKVRESYYVKPVLDVDGMPRFDSLTGEPIVEHFPAFVVEAYGEVPKLPGGWVFAATLQHCDGANIVRKAGDKAPEVPKHYRTVGAHCDHCDTLRNRKDTYLVVNAKGEWRQVGSDCLGDFLGHGHGPEHWAWLAGMHTLVGSVCREESDIDMWGVGRGETVLGMLSFLSAVAGAIRHTGAYVSGRVARDAEIEGRYVMSTKSRAVNYLVPPKATSLREEWEIEERDVELAKAALTWAREAFVVEADSTEFDHNMAVIVKMDCILAREWGLAAYIVEAYRKHLGCEAERTAGLQSAFVGTLGERLKGLELVVTGAHPFDNDFGGGVFFKLLRADGARFTWKASGSPGLEVGMQVELAGTVQRHEEFRGIKETYLTRCKWAEKAEA